VKIVQRSIYRVLRRSLSVIGIFWTSILLTGCGSQLGTYRRLDVNPNTLKLSWSETIWKVQRDGKIFYQVWPNQQDRHFVDELLLPLGSQQQFRYNAFHVDSSKRLITRSKYQELLTGSFGTVFAETTYHYADDYKADNWTTSFTTALYSADVPHEPLKTIDALPMAGGTEINAISVVRIFNNGPDFVVVSANYAHDGHFETISVEGSKNGEWVSNRFSIPGTEGIGHGASIYSGFKTRQAFGLPRIFPIASYLAHPKPVFGSAILTSSLDVVNLHYNRNRWVKQDSYSHGQIQTRFLEFQFTPEDKALETIDRQRLFGEYTYTRDPNWEKEHSD
jgi:hypothetical protein